MTVRQAIDAFEASESDVLPVLEGARGGKLLGSLSEAHALRRYGDELERRNRAFVGV